jgi:hypothetical protein
VNRITISIIFSVSFVLLSQYESRCEFTIKGTATLEVARGGSKRQPVIFDLTLESRGKEYRITAKALGDTWYNNQVVGSDGTFNYFLEQDWPSLDDKMNDKNYKEFGKVGAGVFPQFSARPVQLLWLAYCSQPLFGAGTNSVQVKLSDIRYAKADGLRQIVDYSELHPNLLENIQCYATNVLYVSSKKTNIYLKAPYDHGYLLWRLKITDYTNVGNSTVPLSFEYEQYYPKIADGTNSTDLDCLYKGQFTATNVRETVAAGNLLPEATKQDVPVADWSHHFPTDADGGTPVVAYTMNKNNWISPLDPGLKAQVVAIDQMTHRYEPPRGRSGIKAIVFIFLGTTFFLLCLFIKREIKHKNNN